jgi:hypothetical protein
VRRLLRGGNVLVVTIDMDLHGVLAGKATATVLALKRLLISICSLLRSAIIHSTLGKPNHTRPFMPGQVLGSIECACTD